MEYILLEAILIYFGIYLIIGFGYWMVNAFFAGFMGTEPTKREFYASIIWPISMAALLGQAIRVIIELIK